MAVSLYLSNYDQLWLILRTDGYSLFALSSQCRYLSCKKFYFNFSLAPSLHDTSRGYIVFPDVPHRQKPRFLTQAEHALANSRLKGLVAPSQLKVSRDIFKRVLGRWHWYVFVFHWTLMDQNFTPYSTPFSLYLKAYPDTYSVSRINTLPTIATAISVISAVVSSVVADRLRNWWIPSIVVSIPVLIGLILLVIYDVGQSGRLAGFIITGFEGGEFFRFIYPHSHRPAFWILKLEQQSAPSP
jgi:hypothetical protein